MSHASLAYAAARAQARLGARAGDAVWRTLEASRTAAQVLAEARHGPLAWWVEGLPGAADAARIEAHLHARWRTLVEAVAGWLPPAWQAAIDTFGALALLPSDADDRLDGWARRWSAALPAQADRAWPWRRPAECLRPRLVASRARRAAQDPQLEATLRRLMRRHAGSALAVLAWLALEALDLERLRGALVARTMFEAEAA